MPDPRDQIDIQPLAGPFDIRFPDAARGVPALPGSKSLTNRALLLAALAQGESHLSGVLFSDDTRVMMDALNKLGFKLKVDEPNRAVTIIDGGGAIPALSADLHLGNAGTAMRFLTAACCLGTREPRDGNCYFLDGVPRMRQRPIGELVRLLTSLGAIINSRGDNVDCPPLQVWGTGLRGGEITVGQTLSSQYISALLQVAPYCKRGLTLQFTGPVTSRPYIEMTLALMRQFGVEAKVDDAFTRIQVKPGHYRGTHYAIEPDASSASYFWAAAAITPGSSCAIEGLDARSLQGDVGFAEVLDRMGAPVTQTRQSITVATPLLSESASEGAGIALHGIDIDLNHMPDAAMTLAAIAIFADGPTTIRNVGNWRVKETDRMAAMQTELTKLGAAVTVSGDDITITPPADGEIHHAAIDTYDDHRMAMSFAILGLHPAGPGITINDPRCVEKTFPDFFEYLERLQTAASH